MPGFCCRAHAATAPPWHTRRTSQLRGAWLVFGFFAFLARQIQTSQTDEKHKTHTHFLVSRFFFFVFFFFSTFSFFFFFSAVCFSICQLTFSLLSLPLSPSSLFLLYTKPTAQPNQPNYQPTDDEPDANASLLRCHGCDPRPGDAGAR